MMKISLFLILASGFFQVAPLHQVELLNGRIQLMVPDTLRPISDQMFALKYRTSMRPPMVLSDKDAEVNLICMPTESIATENQLESFRDHMLEEMLKRRSDLRILSKGVRTIDGHKISYFKFISKAIDQNVFNYYFLVILNSKVVFFSFNCTEKLQPVWEKTADQVLESIRIK